MRAVTSAVTAVAAGVVLAGCGFGGDAVAPNSADEGIQAVGRLDGARIAISRGAPIVIVGDCDPEDGPDEDLCIRARTIDGLPIDLVVENRDALVAGETVPVGRATCVDGCDTVTGEIIAYLLVGEDRRIEVTGGEFEVVTADERFAADFDITLPSGGSLDGSFDVAERLPVENPSGVLRPAEDSS